MQELHQISYQQYNTIIFPPDSSSLFTRELVELEGFRFSFVVLVLVVLVVQKVLNIQCCLPASSKELISW
jgi:hypothetical protein